jgi:hypothetical protein
LPFSRRQDADMGMGIGSMGYDVVDADTEMRWMERGTFCTANNTLSQT